jgi:hypothetical protein
MWRVMLVNFGFWDDSWTSSRLLNSKVFKLWKFDMSPAWNFFPLGCCDHRFCPNINFPLHLFHLVLLAICVITPYVNAQFCDLWVNLWIGHRLTHLSFFVLGSCGSHWFVTNFITYDVFLRFHTLITNRFPAQLQLCNERSMSMQETGRHDISVDFHYAAVITCVLLERELDHGMRFSLEPEPTLLANAIQVFSVMQIQRRYYCLQFSRWAGFVLKRSPQVIRYVVLLFIDCTALVLTFIFNSRDVCNMWNLVWIPDQTRSELSFEESARVWWYEQLDLFNITRIQMWWNPAKLYRKKAPKKGIENEQGARTQVQAKQTAQKRQATRRKGNHYESNPPPDAWKSLKLGDQALLSTLELDHYSLKWTSTHQCSIKDGW